MATTTTSTSTTLRTRKSFGRILRRPVAPSASTPDLNAAFTAHSRLSAALSRKTSLAALTPSTLASIPDVSETYALDSVLSDPTMIPATPGRPASADDVVVGDSVEVPGGLRGTVRFVGTVQGKKGQFVGIELNREFAPRGKNNGDVDGISYFNTSVPGSGIFVPVSKAVRRESPSHAAYPATPTPAANRRGPGQSSGYTPPMPALPKLGASIGPGARAPSPQSKSRPRMSLPRPESPLRRTQMTPAPRPSIPSPSKIVRQASPVNRFAQSVRGTAGDPSKKLGRLDHSLNIGQRSNSAMGGGAVMDFDDDPAPLVQRAARQPGLSTSASAFNLRRPSSRANNANEEEIERLKSQLEDRDSQLKEQASTLAEMESSLVELQSLIDQSDGPRHLRNSMDDKDSAQLRLMLREKTEKIAMLTAEFDSHRADFRSTIDTLELASTETERVYEKRMEELMAEIRELESRNVDVDSVANQLKQLEELVQELEEGLEDARRGEAEARGEAEFLRGEVERTRSELRRERDKSGSPGGQGNGGSESSLAKELEQKEDEIRGLKAIIHSLSRDSVPGEEQHTPTLHDSFNEQAAFTTNGASRDHLERRVTELQALLDKKNSRQEELEQEVEHLRRSTGADQGQNGTQNHRSSLRDSRDTVIPARAEPRSPETSAHRRGNTLDTMPESDTYSSETSALWCEICETSGHDILTCTNMFGPEGAKSISNADGSASRAGDRDTLKAPPTSQYTNGADDAARPAPLTTARSKQGTQTTAPIKIMPNPMESGPVAGKESRVMDPEKWCAVCERDGHDSVDCPFEDAF
ncbi:Cytoskeleton-associated protein, Gly-rich domain protein [Cordyceps fumosorosea ARSEF 2679]|uniref:Cytoskeleton-associated protein, Gly-rich domain protein n=1 Tax=Cordyceps fumosorosea (strain ARSEF 2679) TaxID=1081104 RepID=A0A167DYN5_CORFA|nr:Cytoskeleton-associated protein, Gly-rich domain protein [Cordyceps fumosorosea ARSEF 2679]OAA43060.1 Cytoskeleton-associated protein, Gly-rich domain protein [Cordyceps fumosorosea ARSEF 2679]